MPIVNIIKNTVRKHVRYQIKAFTLIESLLTLGISLFLVTLFSVGVSQVYDEIERTLFYIRFEHYYTALQSLAWARQESLQLNFDRDQIRGPEGNLSLPEGVELKSIFQLSINPKGSHTGLSRIVFEEKDRKRQVHYQARIGNGILLRTEEEAP